jgi:NAD(P)-dependent dehydrogenase (short-subunit alcohol dehydrogenase family)
LTSIGRQQLRVLSWDGPTPGPDRPSAPRWCSACGPPANFWGTVNTTKAFLPLLLARPSATLVNVSSMGALVPVPGQSAYGASKAAVKLFTEGLHAELHDSNVKVTVVFPEPSLPTSSATPAST